MAIILITGTPGSGKTLYAMSKIRDALNTGRPIYTNINGCNFDGVEPIPVNNNGELDWTLTPPGDEEQGVFGSLIVYDEAQKLDTFAYKKGEKLSANHIIKNMEDHRHKAYDIIFITQSPKFLHLHLLELVSEHYHVIRRFNRNQAEIHLYRKAEYNVGTKASFERSEDSFAWNYDKKLFEKYKSTVAVTQKGFRLSAKMKRLLFIIVGIFIMLIYFLFFKDNGNDYLKTAVGVETDKKAQVEKTDVKSDKNIATDAKKVSTSDLQAENEKLKAELDMIKQQIATMQNNSVRYNVEQPFNYDRVEYHYQVVDKPQIVGCILQDKKCSCYTQQATTIKMSYRDCKQYTLNRPFNPFQQVSNSSSLSASSASSDISSVQNPLQNLQSQQQNDVSSDDPKSKIDANTDKVKVVDNPLSYISSSN